jgi:nanoRNase/pAp phosphatase (c-di-AMP/oligoRNAs hydrolase)
MNYQNEINKIKDIVSSAKDVLIVTHERPTADSIGAALSLYLGLTSMGKKVTIACPDPITVELSSFIGVNKVATEIGKK